MENILSKILNFPTEFTEGKFFVGNYWKMNGFYPRPIIPSSKLTFSMDYIDIIEILGKLKFPKIYDEKTINEVGNKIPPRN